VPWTPEDYQLRGAEHLKASGAAALWLDPGMRKTSITLKAFCDLQAEGRAKRMLVVAPLKVCRLVWRQEAAKWSDFRHLAFALLHGQHKKKLMANVDAYNVCLINPEGVAWLAAQYARRGADWPFDIVCIDEITKFKNSQAERSKALRGKAGQTPNLLKYSNYRWGLTGTPNPNGYMDLFGQFLLLDDGAALGRYITHYRDQYFSVDYNGFDYNLQPGAEKRIQKRLEPYVFSLDASEFVTLPELLDDPIFIELPDETRPAYAAMKNHLLATLPTGKLEAANTAAAYSKLKQMSGGAVYMTAIAENDDELAPKAQREVVWLHDAKLEALDDLIERLEGQQLLVAYEFNHEKDRLRARYPDMVFLADAKSEAAEIQTQADWNAGRIRLLACHPASAGHGLNLQEGNACHVCWFAPIWDLELWDQFIRRLRRSGNKAAAVIRHVLIVKDTIDELALQALVEKDTTQARLKRSLNTLLHDAETTGATPTTQETTMVTKLSRAGDTSAERPAPKGWGKPAASPEAPQDAATERPAPKGWGRPANPAVETMAERENPAAGPSQSERIQAKLSGEAVDEGSAFSGDVTALKAALEAETDSPLPDGAVLADATPKPRVTRTARGPNSEAGSLSLADIAALLDAKLGPPPQPYVQTDEDKAQNKRDAALYLLSTLAQTYANVVAATEKLAPVDEEGALARFEAFMTRLDALLDTI
jgi:hypothetical protein